MNVFRPILIILVLALFCLQGVCEETTAAQNETETDSSIPVTNHDFINEEFLIACQNEADVKAVPYTGIAKSDIPVGDKKGVRTRDFLVEFINHLLLDAYQNEIKSYNLKLCLSDLGKRSMDCQQYRDWARSDLVKHVQDARFHLSLSFEYGVVPNTNLSVNWKSHKEVPWSPLSKKELENARLVLRKYEKHVKKEQGIIDPPQSIGPMGWKPEATRKLVDGINELRMLHFMRYQHLMSEVRILQYIKSPAPGLAEVQQAAQNLSDNAKAKIRSLIKLKDQLEALGPKERIPLDALDLIKYRAHVEGFLLNSPQFCAVATAVKRTAFNHDIIPNLAIGAGLFLTGYMAPPLVAVLAGVGASVPLGYSAYSDYEKERQRLLTEIYGLYEDSTGDVAKDLENTFRGNGIQGVVEAKQIFYQEITLAPLSLVGGGLAGRTSRALRSTGILKNSSKMELMEGISKDPRTHSWHKLTHRHRIRLQ